MGISIIDTKTFAKKKIQKEINLVILYAFNFLSDDTITVDIKTIERSNTIILVFKKKIIAYLEKQIKKTFSGCKNSKKKMKKNR